VDHLVGYAPRYAEVAERAGLRFPSAYDVDVVERLPGSATTDFGAPAAVADADREKLSKPRAERLADLVDASWAVLDRVAAESPQELRKGPRGGGRGRDKDARARRQRGGVVRQEDRGVAPAVGLRRPRGCHVDAG
jgi:hypothetical protein